MLLIISINNETPLVGEITLYVYRDEPCYTQHSREISQLSMLSLIKSIIIFINIFPFSLLPSLYVFLAWILFHKLWNSSQSFNKQTEQSFKAKKRALSEWIENQAEYGRIWEDIIASFDIYDERQGLKEKWQKCCISPLWNKENLKRVR